MKIVKCMFLVYVFMIQPLSALDLEVTGDWTNTLDVSDLKNGIGSNFTSPQLSANNQTILEIMNCIDDSDNWQINVRRSDSNWHPNLVMQVKRRSDGRGSGTITDGGAWRDITESDQYFFSGSGDRTKIKIKYRVQNVTMEIPVGTKMTTIHYTVIDN